MHNTLKALQENISSQTVELLKEIIVKTNYYIGGFEKKALFTFSNNQNDQKEYTERYFLFISEIASMISKLTDLNAELASLLIKADKEMDIELIVLCEKKFNAFLLFEKDLYTYTTSVENTLDTSNASAVFLINAAQKFKNAVNRLINENS